MIKKQMGQKITQNGKISCSIPKIQKLSIPHLKALNVSFNLKYQTLQKLQGK